jgi:hypothetical protein
VPPTDQDIAGFIRSSFRSVWTLELLLHLARGPDRAWTAEEARAPAAAARAALLELIACAT